MPPCASEVLDGRCLKIDAVRYNYFMLTQLDNHLHNSYLDNPIGCTADSPRNHRHTLNRHFVLSGRRSASHVAAFPHHTSPSKRTTSPNLTTARPSLDRLLLIDLIRNILPKCVLQRIDVYCNCCKADIDIICHSQSSKVLHTAMNNKET